MTDHLGTPRVQTETTGAIVWYAEHEPYGEVHVMRAGAQRHQPLRFPGQEAEQLGAGVGPNGVSSRSYNIFRWYRAGAGRYTQSDPLGIVSDLNLYRYTRSNPIGQWDPAGLSPCGKDPSLANCQHLDSQCCAKKCIDDLSWQVCKAKQFKKDFTLLGILGGAATGAGVGVSTGGLVGMCIGAVAGGVAGGVGGYTIGKEWATAKDFMWIQFKECMQYCGADCDPDDDECHLKQQFDELAGDL